MVSSQLENQTLFSTELPITSQSRALSMDNLKKEHEKPPANKSEKLGFTPTETENFKKAFDDPEFLKMFTEYMDEMQDPKNRQV